LIKTIFFFRNPHLGNHSIEELFGNIMKNLPADVIPIKEFMPFVSKGLFNRIHNVYYTALHQGVVNHITGDVHYIALMMRRSSAILTIHDVEIIRRSRFLKRNFILLFWFILPIRRARYITVISEFTRQELLRYIPVRSSKLRVIPDCLPGTIPFVPSIFNKKCPIILQVGTRHNKNLPNLIKAISGLRCRLLILGELNNAQKELLAQHSVDYQMFTELEYNQVLELYKKCDLLTFVSTYEGFGLPILEAQATGRPVITSRISSMPEVAGDGACLVDPGDASSIRDGIMRVINDASYRDELVSKGRKNAERFKPEIIAERYAELYREIYKDYQSRSSN
jgi:glycosyltransferase involved in cell wall biosynthesis